MRIMYQKAIFLSPKNSHRLTHNMITVSLLEIVMYLYCIKTDSDRLKYVLNLNKHMISNGEYVVNIIETS